MKNMTHVLEKDDIISRIRKNDKLKKQINDSILNATQLNYIPSTVKNTNHTQL